jgi:D-alanyl-D-alanine carboxypeptidase
VLATLVLLPIVVVRLVAASGSDGLGSPGPSGSHAASIAAPTASISATTPTTTPDPSSSGVPACAVGDVPAADRDYDDWSLTLLDPTFRLAPTYVPPDLDSVEEAGFEHGTLLLRSLAIPDLAALREAAGDAGHPIDVLAAYRSYRIQRDLFERRTETLGPAGAAGRTARAGHSEHQLGTTLDFKPLGAADVTQGFGSTPTGRWLAANAYRFGFIESYPAGRTAVTCYAYEPWHFRYVGRAEAAAVHASGLTLREFLWRQEHGAG